MKTCGSRMFAVISSAILLQFSGASIGFVEFGGRCSNCSRSLLSFGSRCTAHGLRVAFCATLIIGAQET